MSRATSILLTGVLGLGGVATGLVVAPAVAVAQTSDSSTADAVGDRVSRIASALSGLVGARTITQEQADAVATTLAEQLPERGRHGHHGPRGLDTAAEVLGVTEDELRTALRDGQSLADVAADRGVERQALVDALVAAASEHLDAKVAEGRLTQAEADEKKAGLAERVEAQVDREGLPDRGSRGPAPDAPTG